MRISTESELAPRTEMAEARATGKAVSLFSNTYVPSLKPLHRDAYPRADFLLSGRIVNVDKSIQPKSVFALSAVVFVSLVFETLPEETLFLLLGRQQKTISLKLSRR
jgi:hypothetical protein